jgi:hypothetical protein
MLEPEALTRRLLVLLQLDIAVEAEIGRERNTGSLIGGRQSGFQKVAPGLADRRA